MTNAPILGVSPQLYQQNGLPDLPLAASAFGVADAACDLPARNALTFAGSAQLVALKPGEKICRVACDPATDPYAQTGGYWTRTPPTQLADVVGGTAVMPEWNNFARVYELTVPTPDPATAGSLPALHAWQGPTAAQPVSGLYPEKQANGYCLAGGVPQLFLPTDLTRHPDFATHIQDVSATHKSWCSTCPHTCACCNAPWPSWTSCWPFTPPTSTPPTTGPPAACSTRSSSAAAWPSGWPSHPRPSRLRTPAPSPFRWGTTSTAAGPTTSSCPPPTPPNGCSCWPCTRPSKPL